MLNKYEYFNMNLNLKDNMTTADVFLLVLLSNAGGLANLPMSSGGASIGSALPTRYNNDTSSFHQPGGSMSGGPHLQGGSGPGGPGGGDMLGIGGGSGGSAVAAASEYHNSTSVAYNNQNQHQHVGNTRSPSPGGPGAGVGSSSSMRGAGGGGSYGNVIASPIAVGQSASSGSYAAMPPEKGSSSLLGGAAPSSQSRPPGRGPMPANNEEFPVGGAGAYVTDNIGPNTDPNSYDNFRLIHY